MRFASGEWVGALVAAVNAQPDLPRALAGLGKDLAAVVEADPPAFPATVAAWGRHERGRIGEWRLLEDEEGVGVVASQRRERRVQIGLRLSF